MVMRTIGWMILAAGMAAGQTATTTPMFAPAPGTAFPAAAAPRMIVAGDFNGDQVSDVAVVSPSTNSVTVLLGTLNGALGSPSSPIPTGHLPSSAAVGYFRTNNAANGAYPLDIVVTNTMENTVTILVNDGLGNFAPTQKKLSVGPQPTSIVVSDFNQDGKMDIGIANSGDGSITIWFGDGSGNFENSITSTSNVVPGSGSQTVSMAAGVFGGLPGVVVANQSAGTVTVFSVQPSAGGSFVVSSLGSYPVLGGLINPPYPYPAAVFVADVNGDGYPDIVTANEGTGNISVLLGNPQGSFTYSAASPISVGANPTSIATADFNGDGIPDLAVTDYGSGTVVVLLGDGTGNFKAPAGGSVFTAGASPVSVAVGDFNGQSRASLAVANEGDNTVTVLLNSAVSPLAIVSEASFTSPISPGSLISIFGSGMASATAPPTTYPAFTMADTSVTITYSDSMQDTLRLYSVSPSQVNAVIPAPGPSNPVSPVPGLATISVITLSKTQTSVVEIASYAPALYSANGNGKGAALGSFMSNDSQMTGPLAQCNTATPPVCSPEPLDFSAGGTLYLTATGLSNIGAVSVIVGSMSGTGTVTSSSVMPGVYSVAVTFNSPPITRGLVPVMLMLAPQTGKAIFSNVVSILIE